MITTFSPVLPVLVLGALSFLLMPLTAFARIRAVATKKMKASEFKLMEFKDPPELVKKTTRHWTNLYEVPTVFYALCLLSIFLAMDDKVLFYAAWSFVVFRYLHAIVHVTYNSVPHRFFCFVASNLSLLVIWIRILMAVCDRTEQF
mgnify:CR=1 FL=1